MGNEDHIEVPIAWLQQVQKLAKNAEIALDQNIPNLMAVHILIGYISSVKTIIKYNQKS